MAAAPAGLGGPGGAAPAGHLGATRRGMVAAGPAPMAWPLFECRVTHTSAEQSLVHFCVNLFIMDGVTDLTMRRELSALYRDHTRPLPQPALSYQDYCLSLHGANGAAGIVASDEHRRAKAFWWERISSLPPAPELPVLLDELRQASVRALLGGGRRRYTPAVGGGDRSGRAAGPFPVHGGDIAPHASPPMGGGWGGGSVFASSIRGGCGSRAVVSSSGKWSVSMNSTDG